MARRLDCMVILTSLLVLYSCVEYTHGTQYPPTFPPDQARDMYIQVYENHRLDVILRSINASDRNGDNVTISTADGETAELIDLRQTKFGSQAVAELYLRHAVDRDHNPSIRQLKFKATDNISERDTVITAYLDIKDVNDETPKFNTPSYQFNIPEDTLPNNSVVFDDILVTDADTGLNQRFSLSLEPDGQSAADFLDVFVIRQKSNAAGNSTGEIILKKPLDYERLTFYQYVIKAVDQGTPPNTGTADLIIKVTDVQDTPPFFQRLPYMKEIKEDITTGDTVLTVKAEDGDRGVPNKIEYSFVKSGNCTDFFHIERSNGVVTVAEHLDRDTGVIRDLNGVCRLTVKASEVQNNNTGGNSTATTPMTITIQDVNDESPTFDKNTYFAKVRENLTNIPITIINSTGIHVKDLDQGLFSQFDVKVYKNSSEYSLLSPIPNSIMSDGEIRIQLNSQPFDYEKEHQIVFEVLAEERANRTHISTCTVSLSIIDTNDNSPIFTNSSYEVTIPEGSANYSHVVTLSANDADSGEYGAIHYQLRNGGQQFVINNKTGEIRTNCDPAELDYEKRNVYYLTVEAIDGGGGRTPTSVIVHLEDVNDNPPLFISNRYEVTVKENDEHFSTNPFIVKAVDRDQPGTKNSAFKYDLSIDDELKTNFTINSTSGEITLVGTLDYEKIDFEKLGQPAGKIELYAVAEDLGTPPLRSNTTIVIHVQDVNDNAPEFNQSFYNASFNEGKLEGLNVTTVFAEDADASYPNNDIRYYISKGGLDRFFIDSSTGIITTSYFNFDRETLDSYHLIVIARDIGSPPKTGTAKVFIKLIDVNDHRPFFSKESYHQNVWENATVNTTVLTCNASDPDFDHNLVYSIINITAIDENNLPVNASLDKQYFDIKPNTGRVYVKSPLDRETATTISLTILVTDTNAVVNAPQNDTAIVYITLLDINDNAPQFTENVYKSNNIRESASNGEIVITVTATDKDINNKIIYSIYNNPKNGFKIDNITGVIKVLQGSQLDREDQPQMNITVMADDGLINSTAVVVVDLIDINDNAPVFVSTNQSFQLLEAHYNSTVVHHFNATDNDTGMNANLTYFIEDQALATLFHIDEYSGILTVDGDLDRETLAHYTIVLLCKDNPILETTQKTGTITITITVQDINDNYPQFNQDTYTGELSENSDMDRIVLTVQAHDKDEGLNGEVYYNISNGNASDLFRINSKTGVIKVNSILRDLANTYLLIVSAEDKGDPPRQNFTEVSITVMDQNNHAPEFTNNHIQSSVYECARNGTYVGNVTATDKDKDPNNKKISYKFVNSSTYPSIPFVIDIDTGRIYVNKKLDANTTSLYRLKVNASDHGDPIKFTISEDVIIYIKDVNDNPPIFDKPHYETRIAEEGTHENFYTVVAFDADKDSNTTYKLDQNAYNFSINEFTGELSLNSPIDREKNPIVNLTVHAQDSTLATNYSSQCDRKQQTQFNATKTNIIVIIEDINDNPPRFKSKQLTVGVRRDIKQTSEILNLKDDVTDNDIGANAVHTFKRLGQFDASPEFQDQIRNPTNDCPGSSEKSGICVSGNGSVTLNMVLRATAKGTINFKVMVEDSAGNDTSELEIIIVGDSQTVQMTILAPKDEVSKKKSEIMAHLEQVLKKYQFISHDVQPYVSSDGKRDDFKTNLLFHVQEKATKRILSAEEAKSLIDSNTGNLYFLLEKYKVTQIQELQLQHTSDDSEQLKQTYVLVAVIALLGGVVLILGYFLCNTITKYKRRLKAATIKTRDKDEKRELDFIPGSNEFAAKVNPLLNKEVKANEAIPNDYDSVNSLDVNEVDYSKINVKSSEMEEKEAIMEMYGDDYFKPDDNVDPIQLALNEHNRQLTENYHNSLLQNTDPDLMETGYDNPVIYQQLETTEV